MTSQPLSPRILFEDNHLIILSKPAGLLSQGEHKGEPNLVDWLRQYLGRPYVGLIHRLDRNTSGIMVVAKRSKSANRLTTSLQEGQLIRSYLAWLIGDLPAPCRWSHHLKKLETKNKVLVVTSGGRRAHLNVKPLRHILWKGTPLTLAEFHLETGRSHQIRVQSSHMGFPLLGDVKYGSSAPGFKEAPPFHRVALHSYQVEFPHPISGEILKWSDPLPKDLDLDQQVKKE